MKPSKIDTTQSKLFMNLLANWLNPKDPLFIMASEMNWSFLRKPLALIIPMDPANRQSL
jgi:hypothetical protein